MDVLFLGTAGAVPTARRAPSATLVRRGGERILVDCAEGTQRQLLRSVAGLSDVDLVLLTHHHADHVLGLPGMMKTFALRDREQPLVIAGPRGLSTLMTGFAPVIGRLTYEVEVRELEPGEAIECDGYRVEPFATRHGTPSLGYALCEQRRPGRFDLDAARAAGVPDGPLFGRLQAGERVTLDSGAEVDPAQVLGPPRPGRRIVFSGDTRPCPETVEAAAAAELLVHEATFTEEEAERARQTGHSTAVEAARLAVDAQVAMLALTHISTRHTAREIRDEARGVFPGTVVPRDLDLVEVPFAEKGGPRLIRSEDLVGEPVTPS
ncbi:MAG: ribonuclease Z [Gaiellales bacterium]